MQVHILASGSSGNSIYFKIGNTQILVDAGISARRIEQGLAQVGVSVKELDAVLITHEHTDHVKGLDVLIRKHRLPVFTRPRTWEMIRCTDNLPLECVHSLDKDLEIKDVYIKPFSISHDAVDPVGYCFYYDNHKYVLATDLGIAERTVVEAIDYADLVVLESNHDLSMLRNGSYPTFLKKRIAGSQGHLSNIDAGKLLAKVKKRNSMRVFLAHLSQQNNLPSLAEDTVTRILENEGCIVGDEIVLYRTFPFKVSSYIA